MPDSNSISGPSQGPFEIPPLSESELKSLTPDPFKNDSLSRTAIKDYMLAVSSATRAQSEALYDAIQTDIMLRSNLYTALAQQSADLQNSYQGILNQLAIWRNVRIQQTAENAVISNYNTTSNQNKLKSAVEALNKAIALYNAGGSAGDYKSAVEEYNKEALPILNAYNTATINYNQFISGVQNFNYGMPNLNMGLASLPLLPNYLTGNEPPGVPPIPNPVPLPLVPVSPAAPSNVDGLELYFLPIARNLLIASGNVDIFRAFEEQRLIDVRDFRRLTRGRQGGIDAVTEGAAPIGTGSAVMNYILGSESRLIDRITTSLYKVVNFEQSKPLPADVIDQLQLFSVFVMSKAAVAAGDAVSRQLSAQSVAPKGIPVFFDVSSALAFNNSLQTAIGSSGIAEGVRAIINANEELSKLSLSEKQELAAALTAATNLSLLQIGVSQLALALNTPELVPQLFGAAIGLQNLFGPSTDGNINRLLDDPSLRNGLVKLLQSIVPGIPPESIRSAVLVASGQSRFETPASFNNALSNALLKAGLTGDQIPELLQSVSTYLESQSALPFLGQPFVPGPLVALTSDQASQAPVGSPQSDALLKLLRSAGTITSLPQALEGAIASTPSTIREFRDQLIENLVNSGVSPAEAAGVANTASSVVAPPSVVSSGPLQNSHPAALLSRSELLEALTATVSAQLSPTLGTGVQRVQDQTHHLVISILDRMIEQIQQLKVLSREDSQKRAILDEFYKNAQDVTFGQQGVAALKSTLTEIIKTQVEAVQTGTSPVDQSDLRTRHRPPGSRAYKADIDIPA